MIGDLDKRSGGFDSLLATEIMNKDNHNVCIGMGTEGRTQRISEYEPTNPTAGAFGTKSADGKINFIETYPVPEISYLIKCHGCSK